MCSVYVGVIVFFCVKQKTAYEVRISDWSSDVCSSDLSGGPATARLDRRASDPAWRGLHACAGRADGSHRSERCGQDHLAESAHVPAGRGSRPGSHRWSSRCADDGGGTRPAAFLSAAGSGCALAAQRSEEHTSELQSLMRISSAVFCL